MKVGASEVFKDKSGRYLKADGSGRVEIATASDTGIIGWALSGEFTASATEGASKVSVETDINKLMVMPACGAAGAAITEATLAGCIGETHDIQMVSTNYQYMDTNASAVDILLCLGYIYEGSAAGQQYGIVRINAVKAAYITH
jgi:hypothetical protein